MGTTQRQLRDTVQANANRAEERFEGYRVQLAATTLDILGAERSHVVAPTNIVQKVTNKCESLGDLLERRTEGEAGK